MKKVLAVIVTYNRLLELKQCLEHVRQQSSKSFDILVVNNGSTDGTREFLAKEKDLKVINQDNLGGSGGFYTGEKYALDNGYEWVWLMDDDGIPVPNQLENLFIFQNKHPEAKVLNALVVDKESRNQLSFMFGDWDFAKTQTVECVNIVSPYNGTLIHRSVMEDVGLTKKEMFIWGDEIEYIMRIQKAGYQVYTPTNAIHYHPKERSQTDIVLPHIINKKILVKPKKFSKYYYRNQGYIHQIYYRTKWYKGLKPMFYYAIYYLRKLYFAETYKVVKYYIKGLNSDFEV